MTDNQYMNQAMHTAEEFLRREESDIYDASVSVVWAFDSLGLLREVTRADDAYMALHQAQYKPFMHGELGIVITTCGWAAPLGSTDVPSEHPDRTRCFMVVGADRQMQTATLVRMKGKEDIEPTGPGTGPIAESISRAVLLMSLTTAALRIARDEDADAQ